MKERIYICHTYYHVYVTCLKELLILQDNPIISKAAIILSSLSTDFGNLRFRLNESNLFSEIFEYDEKRLSPPAGSNIICNMVKRIIFTKKQAKAQIPYLPTNFRDYRDIYVYCDSDPIGYYLNWAKIPYHAIEDGLNCLVLFDAAKYDNRKFFRFKTWMSARNLIFIQNGYGKYCLDMEVNDISVIENHCPKYIEKSRDELVKALNKSSVELLLNIFITNLQDLTHRLNINHEIKGKTLILTEPLSDLETRKKLFAKIIDQYGQLSERETQIIIKPHPMDEVDYQSLFPGHIVLDSKFPMEILNLVPGLFFDRVVSIFTVPLGIKFAGEIINLGSDFKDDNDDSVFLKEKLNRYAEEVLLKKS